jgi:hypothetical protein
MLSASMKKKSMRSKFVKKWATSARFAVKKCRRIRISWNAGNADTEDIPAISSSGLKKAKIAPTSAVPASATDH